MPFSRNAITSNPCGDFSSRFTSVDLLASALLNAVFVIPTESCLFPTVSPDELGAAVGVTDGVLLGAAVGVTDGVLLGATVGVTDGVLLGADVGVPVGAFVGAGVGVLVVPFVGAGVGVLVVPFVGAGVGVPVVPLVGVALGAARADGSGVFCAAPCTMILSEFK